MLIFLAISLLIAVLFFWFQGLSKMEKVPKMKQYASHLEQEGLQELKLAMIGTPGSQLTDLVSARVHEAGRSAPSLSASSSAVEGWWAPSPLGPIPKRAHHAPTTSTPRALGTLPYRKCPFPQAPLKPSLAPQEAICICQSYTGVLLSPATSLSLHFLLGLLCKLT